MADFIEFIVKNFFVVIIVVGFIASLLRKAKKNGNQRAGRMPDFGGGGRTAAPRDSRSFEQRERQAADRPLASPFGGETARRGEVRSGYGKTPTASANETEERDQSASAIRERAMHQSLSSTRREDTASAPPADRQSGFRLPDGDELRRAFILSEVLGPPRSRNPLRRR